MDEYTASAHGPGPVSPDPAQEDEHMGNELQKRAQAAADAVAFHQREAERYDRIHRALQAALNILRENQPQQSPQTTANTVASY